MTKNKWTYAKRMADMPKKRGRYLFMNCLGMFFVGLWETKPRELNVVHPIAEMVNGVRTTTGRNVMSRWDFKKNGHVFWTKPTACLDFYKICRRCGVGL